MDVLVESKWALQPMQRPARIDGPRDRESDQENQPQEAEEDTSTREEEATGSFKERWG